MRPGYGFLDELSKLAAQRPSRLRRALTAGLGAAGLGGLGYLGYEHFGPQAGGAEAAGGGMGAADPMGPITPEEADAQLRNTMSGMGWNPDASSGKAPVGMSADSGPAVDYSALGEKIPGNRGMSPIELRRAMSVGASSLMPSGLRSIL